MEIERQSRCGDTNLRVVHRASFRIRLRKQIIRQQARRRVKAGGFHINGIEQAIAGRPEKPRYYVVDSRNLERLLRKKPR
jgi:hypothetical protein